MINRRNFLQHAGAVSLAGLGATLAGIRDVQAADTKPWWWFFYQVDLMATMF